jgi:hypothetical protein
MTKNNFKNIFTLGLFALVFFGFAGKASAATYYVSTAYGDNTNCTGLSQAAYVSGTEQPCPFKTIAKINSLTFLPGDTILFKRGETFIGSLNPASSGSDGNQITFSAYDTGDLPIIDGTTTYAITIRNGRSYVTISHLQVQNGTSQNIQFYNTVDNIVIDHITSLGDTSGIVATTGNFSNITISNFTTSGLGATHDGININGAISSNIEITNLVEDGGRYGLYFSSTTNNSNIAIYNSTVSGNANHGMAFSNVVGLIMEGLTAKDNGAAGFYLGGTFTDVDIQDVIATSNTMGILMESSVSASNISIDNSILSSSTSGSGVSFAGSGINDGAIVTNTTAANNLEGDGFNVHGTWTNVIFDNCVADSNGTDGIGADGDGFSFHDTSTGTIRDSVSKNNLKSAVAHVDSAHVSMHDNLFYHATNGTIPLCFLAVGGDYEFYNNTIYSGGNTGTIISTSGAAAAIKNNIVYGGSYGIIADNNAVEDFNDVFGASTANYNGFVPGINSVQLDPLFVNNSSDFHILSTSPAIDAGTNVGLTNDYAGNPIYGTPDIGAYEYQPPYITGTDKIDIQAGARIYADGKFRDLQETSSNLADLTITPAAGFNSYASDEARPEFLDITDLTWNTTKRWTESSEDSSLTNTVHTIGDLTPNKYYNVSLDNTLGQNITGTHCTDGVCLSNDQGKITFLYTGTYSTHIFTVEEGDNTPPTVTNETSPKFHTDTEEVTLSITTNEDSTCKYSTEDTTYDNMTNFETTGEKTHITKINNLSPNPYAYYAICRDSNTNETTYALNFEIAQKEEKADISDPKIKIDSDNQSLDEKTKIYVDKDQTKLKGKDQTIANGKVRIYKDNKRYDTVGIDDQGSWSKTISFGHSKSYKLKLKFYDEFNTLRDTKEYEIKVDTENPVFENQKENNQITKDEIISFSANDEDSKIDYYRVKLLDNQGHILRPWRKQKEASYEIPEAVKDQAQTIIARAYDKAGNKSEQIFEVTTTQSLASDVSGQVEVQGVQTTKEEQTQTEDRVTNPLQQTETTTTPEELKQTAPDLTPENTPVETKDSHWYNPFSWF